MTGPSPVYRFDGDGADTQQGVITTLAGLVVQVADRDLQWDQQHHNRHTALHRQPDIVTTVTTVTTPAGTCHLVML